MSLTREQLTLLSRYNETTERFEAMRGYIKKVILMPGPLSVDERNLFSVAYKNCASPLRTSQRAFVQLETKEKNKNSANLDLILLEKSKVESELTSLCQEVLDIVTKDFIEKQEGDEAKVFFWKMTGDYYRYMCEYLTDSELENTKIQAKEAYEEGMKLAQGLEHLNSIKLGLILNYSVFHYEILNDDRKATEIAKEGFDNGMASIDMSSCCEGPSENTTLLQLIRDNMMMWNQEGPEEES